MDDIHVFEINKWVTVCNCFVNNTSNNINEEMITPINANAIEMGATVA